MLNCKNVKNNTNNNVNKFTENGTRKSYSNLSNPL